MIGSTGGTMKNNIYFGMNIRDSRSRKQVGGVEYIEIQKTTFKMEPLLWLSVSILAVVGFVLDEILFQTGFGIKVGRLDISFALLPEGIATLLALYGLTRAAGTKVAIIFGLLILAVGILETVLQVGAII